MAGAGSVLASLTATCAGQYVILLTDGLPTMSLDGKAWPPLGSEAGAGYGVYATFAGRCPRTHPTACGTAPAPRWRADRW